VGGAEVDEEDLVFDVVDEGDEFGDEFGFLAGVEFAEEDGELGVVAATLEGVEDAGAAFVVGDVVGDEVVASGGHVRRWDDLGASGTWFGN